MSRWSDTGKNTVEGRYNRVYMGATCGTRSHRINTATCIRLQAEPPRCSIHILDSPRQQTRSMDACKYLLHLHITIPHMHLAFWRRLAPRTEAGTPPFKTSQLLRALWNRDVLVKIIPQRHMHSGLCYLHCQNPIILMRTT